MPHRRFDLVIEGDFKGVVRAEIRRQNAAENKDRNYNQTGHRRFIAPQLAQLINKRMAIFRIFFWLLDHAINLIKIEFLPE